MVATVWEETFLLLHKEMIRKKRKGLRMQLVGMGWGGRRRDSRGRNPEGLVLLRDQKEVRE